MYLDFGNLERNRIWRSILPNTLENQSLEAFGLQIQASKEINLERTF